jgi:hypothetical protein
MGTKNYLHMNTASIQSAIIRSTHETEDNDISTLEKRAEKAADGVNVHSLADQMLNNVVTVRCCSNGTNGNLNTRCSTNQPYLAKYASVKADRGSVRSIPRRYISTLPHRFNHCCLAAEGPPSAEFSCRRQSRAYCVNHVSSQVFN